MKRSVLMLGVAGALAICALTVPATANASCTDRRVTGTVLGGIGGALIGNSISRGGGGAVIGGLGGALAGNAIAGSGCHGYYRGGYYRGGYYRSGYYDRRYRSYGYAEPYRARYVYYDRFGNPAPIPGEAPYPQPVYAGSAGCRTDSQSYYDDRGALVQRQVQVCAR
jgi:hypothetical protein